MARVRVSVLPMVVEAVFSCLFTCANTPLNLPNSVLTAANTCQISPECLCMAKVWNPMRRLFRRAAKVVGPAMVTRQVCCNLLTSSGCLRASAYRPSVGRNMMAKLVVAGGSMYFSDMSRAEFSMDRFSAFSDCSMAFWSARSVASNRR